MKLDGGVGDALMQPCLSDNERTMSHLISGSQKQFYAVHFTVYGADIGEEN